jgi:hypothetical protein
LVTTRIQMNLSRWMLRHRDDHWSVQSGEWISIRSLERSTSCIFNYVTLGEASDQEGCCRYAVWVRQQLNLYCLLLGTNSV